MENIEYAKGKEGGNFKCRIITKKRALKKAGRSN